MNDHLTNREVYQKVLRVAEDADLPPLTWHQLTGFLVCGQEYE